MAKKETYSAWEGVMKTQIKTGPRAAGPKPWVTIYSPDLEGEHFMYLPMMVADGTDMDTVMVDQARPFPKHFLDTSKTLPRHFLDTSQTLPRHFPDAS